MTSVFKSLIYRVRRNPLRIALIVATVAMGTAILGLSLSLSSSLSSFISGTLDRVGKVVSFTNGTLSADGTLDRVFPSTLTQEAVDGLSREYPELKDITPIGASMPWGQIRASGYLWSPRSVAGVGPSYASLMGLEMAAGSFFTAEDVDQGARVVVVSDAVARTLFGGVDQAVGQTVTAMSKMMIVRKTAGDPEPVQQATLQQTGFKVIGVYREVPDVIRDAYGVGDFLAPYTSLMPGGRIVAAPMVGYMARVSTDALSVARAKITRILQGRMGADFKVAVWEGGVNSPDAYVADVKKSLTMLSVFISAFGVLVLIVSSFGILGIMMVEIMDRTREIGLRRAVGSTQGGILGSLVGQAASIALLGAAVGVVLTAALYRPLLSSLAPYLQTAVNLRMEDLPGVGAASLAAAVGIAVGSGALFALIPAGMAARRPIVGCLREE